MPLVLPCAGLVCGIWAEAAVCWPMLVWVAISGLAVAVYGVADWCQSPVWCRVALIVAAGGLGGVRHHQDWSCVSANHISHKLRETSQPCRIVGRVLTPPVVLNRPGAVQGGWGHSTWWRCELGAEWMGDRFHLQPISGDLEFRGVDSPSLQVGDRVDVYGRVCLPPGLRNPGGFDARAAYRRRGIAGIFRAAHPGCVRVIGVTQRPDAAWFPRWRALRSWIRSVLSTALTPRTQGIAAALLIGDRSGLDHDDQRAFVLSGTMHLLAISGLHVGVLASLLSCACRALGVSRRASGVTVVLTIIAYVFLVGSRPSVVRAAVLVSVWMLGRPWWRQSHVWHRLSLAAIGMMLWDPLVVFDVGAQLSYLAMLALSYSQISSTQCVRRPADDARSIMLRLREHAWHTTIIDPVVRHLMAYLRAYVAIWVFTAPLAANSFHVLAPIGVLTNLVLIHTLGLILLGGFLMVSLAVVNPAFAELPGVCLDAVLRGVLWFVEWSSCQAWGHVEVVKLPVWWMVCHYCLLCVVLHNCWRLRSTRWRHAVVVWLLIGVLCLIWRRAPGELRCQFLDVGHGSAVLIELPAGQTLLYDCGSMQGGQRAAQVVQRAMRSGGMSHLDTLVISHADVDHCNGVSTLLERVSVGRIVIGRAFGDLQQQVVRDVLGSAGRHKVPICTVAAGQQLAVDPQTRIKILHPYDHWISSSDNANSLVLRICYAGRVLLLPGDLEADGLEHLLKLPAQQTDVLMAPHHGSRTSNTLRVAEWARPHWVIVSSGRHIRLDALQSIYKNSRVIGTSRAGAIEVRIRPTGQLHVTTVRPQLSMVASRSLGPGHAKTQQPALTK